MAFYLAMTATEMQHSAVLPRKLAYMACHFSPYAIGLSNLPDTLPESSIIILNDRMPIAGHDPNCIAQQLTQLSERTGAAGILLDLQRPDCQETAALVQALTKSISCPIAISPSYAVDNFPVFLPPFPINTPLEEALAPWKSREIWLDVSPGQMCITVNASGATDTSAECPSDGFWQYHDDLCCHYQIQTDSESAHFFLYRTQEDIQNLLEKAKAFGVTTAVGLYQELAASDFEKL